MTPGQQIADPNDHLAAERPASDQKIADQALLAAAKAGDNQAMEMLLGRYKGLVRQKAASMYMAGADSEDVIQEGMIGLFKAIRDYQPDRDASFATFASLCVSAQITDAVRQASRHKHRLLNESLSLQSLQHQHGDIDQSLPALEWPASDENPEQRLLSREREAAFIDFITNHLSPLERQVIRLYLQALTYHQIAELLHCSTKRVDNALQRARQKIARYHQLPG